MNYQGSSVVTACLLACLGNAQTLPRLQHIELPGQTFQHFGQVLAIIGDVDNDGIEDFAVGTPEETVTQPTTMSHAGVVRVFSGATGAILYTLNGQNASDRFGWTIAGGGDVDADGTPDILVGIPYGTNTAATGNVQVYAGRTGLLIRTVVAGLLYGYAIATADLDGDGFSDIITSSGEFALPSASHINPVKAYSGFNGQLIGMYSGIPYGANNPAESWGMALAAGRDLNGDGRPDILIGYSSAGGLGNQHGGVYAVSGASGVMFRVFTGAPVFTFLGERVAFIQDLNGDGVPDVVAGGYGNGSVSVPGSIWVFSGATGAVIRSVSSAYLSDGFGGVAAGRDLDGDGIEDYATSTPGVNPSGPVPPGTIAIGLVRAYSGATGQLIGIVPGRGPGMTFGGPLGMIGDSNGDGFGELVVGSPLDDTVNWVDAGSVDVVEFMGAQSHGSANGPLQLLLLPGSAQAAWVASLGVLGATPLAPGFLGVSLGSANGTLGNPAFPVYIAVNPSLLLLPITFDWSGVWLSPLNVRVPALAGTVVYTQTFDLGGAFVQASNGLSILFGG